jgi:hypothetical protein
MLMDPELGDETPERIANVFAMCVVTMTHDIANSLEEDNPAEIMNRVQREIFAGIEFLKTEEGKALLSTSGSVH